jgi:hypothetical protein
MMDPHDIPMPQDLTAPNEGSDRDTPYPSLLDDERVASMADEGGVSGALMELEDPGERKHLMYRQHSWAVDGWRKAAAAVALLGLAVFAMGWLRRNA